MQKLILGTMLMLFISGQKVDSPPTVTAEQKLEAQALGLRIENAQLKMHIAQTELERAKADVDAFVKSMQRDGWAFDPATMAYTKAKDPK